MREFPDDEACLTYLWRSQYSEDGANVHCTRCDRERAFKPYQTAQRRQSWQVAARQSGGRDTP